MQLRTMTFIKVLLYLNNPLKLVTTISDLHNKKKIEIVEKRKLHSKKKTRNC